MENKINASELQRKGLKRVYENIDRYSSFLIENTRKQQELYITKYKDNLGSIIQEIRKHKEELNNEGFEKIAIFGSVATGKSTSKSDVDISFELKDKKSGLINIAKKKNTLSKILNKIDNLDLHHFSLLKASIKEEIVDKGISVI